MQKTGSKVFCSATDLTHFAECQHLSWLDRLHLDEPMEKTVADEHAKLIQAKGFSHEASFLDKLTARHAGIVAIDTKGSLEERAAQTRAAIASGAEAIYQASFIGDNLIGHADFLTRVGPPNASGSYRYEAAKGARLELSNHNSNLAPFALRFSGTGVPWSNRIRIV